MEIKICKTKKIYAPDNNTKIFTVTAFDVVHFPRNCPTHTQTYVQLTAQLVLLLLHVSAANCSHLQEATNVEYMYSLLQRLSNNIYIYIYTYIYTYMYKYFTTYI